MSRSDWQDFQLGELCSFKAGSAFPQSAQGLSEGDLPFIKVSDMNLPENKIRVLASNNWVSFDTAKTLKAAPLQSGVPVFAKIGEALKANRIRRLSRPTIVDNNMMGAVPTSDEIDELFLFHLLRQLDLAQWATGTSVPYLTVSVLSQIQIRIPPKVIQRRIAAILTAYDDLIENNTRRIAILEEMARRLYEKWFVHFRFPGHESVRFKETELGRIPEDWEVAPLENVCKLITDGAHKSPPKADDGMPMASVKDMHDWGLDLAKCRKISEKHFMELVRNNCKPEPGDILIAKDGSYLKHCFVVEKDCMVVLLSSIALLRPNNRIRPNIMALYLRHPKTMDRMRGYVSGVAIPRIILKDFRQFKIVLPGADVQKAWSSLADPMMALCRRLIDKNTNLRAQRDLLLPKLVSGDIDVSDMPLREPSSEAT